MAFETKTSDVEKQKAEQEELSRRLATKTHVPNPVPEVEETKAAEVAVKKLKVEKVFVNKTFQVTDGKAQLVVSIPSNRADPKVGDTVELHITGEKDSPNATWPKPKEHEAKAAAK